MGAEERKRIQKENEVKEVLLEAKAIFKIPFRCITDSISYPKGG